MKARFQNRLWFLPVAALTAFFVPLPALRADWGSVRANNRSPEHHEAGRRVHERGHEDIEEERRQAFYWAGFSPGMAVAALPPGCAQISVGGYYYFDGVYFQAMASGTYTVIAPPVGAVVPQLPSGAEPIAFGPTTYYYAGGAFYVQQTTGFAVLPAPLGVTVTALPPGASPVTINGQLYYLADYVYYLPGMAGGVTVYTTAHP